MFLTCCNSGHTDKEDFRNRKSDNQVPRLRYCQRFDLDNGREWRVSDARITRSGIVVGIEWPDLTVRIIGINGIFAA